MNGRERINSWRARPLAACAGLALALAGALAGCGNSPWPDGSEGQSVIRSAMTESTPRRSHIRRQRAN